MQVCFAHFRFIKNHLKTFGLFILALLFVSQNTNLVATISMIEENANGPFWHIAALER